MSDPKVKMIKFGGNFCAPCRAMDKKKLLENFAAKHPNVILEKVSIDNPDHTEHEEGMKLAEIYNVSSIPVIVFEDEKGNEIGRQDAITNAGELEDLYKSALARLKYKMTGKVEVEEDDE